MTRDELDKYLARLNSWQEAIGFKPVNHAYTFNGIPKPSVSELMRPMSMLVYGAETNHFAKLAMDRGKRAHAAMESMDAVGIYPVQYDTLKYVEAYAQWRDSRPEFEIIANEKRVCGGPYCGTFDKLAHESKLGRVYLIDIKTGETAHPELWNVQMDFYDRALRHMGLYISGAFVVQCKKDGSFVEHECKSHTGMPDHLLKIYWYFENAKEEKECTQTPDTRPLSATTADG
jgi:hypothetical protein